MPIFAPHPLIEADSIHLRDLPLCQLRLQNQSAVPWLVLVPRREGATEIYKLSAEDQAQLLREITLASNAIAKLFTPKINVAALGNVVAQLHVHVIGRYNAPDNADAAWPKPVWGNLPPAPYEPKALANMRRRLGDEGLWR